MGLIKVFVFEPKYISIKDFETILRGSNIQKHLFWKKKYFVVYRYKRFYDYLSKYIPIKSIIFFEQTMLCLFNIQF